MNLKEWHKSVCENAKYVCVFCFKDFSYDCYFDENGVNQYVCGDHIQTQKAHPEKKFDIANGRCVCLPCHNKRHSQELNKFT